VADGGFGVDRYHGSRADPPADTSA